MKTIKFKTLFAIALLSGLIAIVSCEDENELKYDPSRSDAVSHNEKNTEYISNGFTKAQLIDFAYESYANWYDVILTSKNTQVINKATLQAWVSNNEKNKHKEINQKNKTALAQIANQEKVNAILVKAPDGAMFQESVFVISKSRALVITDIYDITNISDIWPIVATVKDGLNGRSIHCICVEKNVIAYSKDDITHCSGCPLD